MFVYIIFISELSVHLFRGDGHYNLIKKVNAMMKLSIQFCISLFGKKWHWGQKQTGANFMTSATQTIGALSGARAKSTIDNYRTALNSFSAYSDRMMTLKDINASVLEGYQRWLTEKGMTLNTISCYMRSLRSLIHKLQPETDVRRLFCNVFTGKEPTEKRSITIAEIGRLRKMELTNGMELAFSRDLFLFSFYALGMPFVDMAFLRKSQVTGGYIVYLRHKTNQRINIKIEPLMQEIMERYDKSDSPYVFPILNSIDQEKTIKEYETARRRYNRHLKRLSQMAGTKVLTSYVARHSWASMAYHANIDLPVISKALGHTSPNTTLTYIRSIDDNRIDTANHMLLERLL